MKTEMSKEITDIIEKFHAKAIDAKTHNERGTSTMNEIYEGLMSLVLKKEKLVKHWEAQNDLMQGKLEEYVKANHDLKEEIEEQVNVIIEQKNELKQRDRTIPYQEDPRGAAF